MGANIFVCPQKYHPIHKGGLCLPYVLDDICFKNSRLLAQQGNYLLF